MKTAYQFSRLQKRPRAQRGQTAVIALLVLLLLSFVGALFITIVASNLSNQGRSQRTLNADYYAQAGLRYANAELTNSLAGADWRPPLQYQLLAPTYTPPPSDTIALARYNEMAANLQPPNANDPDFVYLEQGFTRYDTEGGRFLIRVTYNPIASTAADPNQRYIKIESIGRVGLVNPNDPTTYANQAANKLAATLVAYKPIGITDYARFETNIDNRSNTMNLGVPSEYTKETLASATPDNAPSGIVTPGVFDFNINSGGGTPAVSTTQPLLPFPIATEYGSTDAYMENAAGIVEPMANPMPSGFTAVPGGGAIRANGNLRFYGVNDVYLNRPPPPPPPASTFPVPNIVDDIEVSGRLLLDGYNPNASLDNTAPDSNKMGQTSALILHLPANGNPPITYATPSNDPTGFSTEGGAVRDGGSGGNASDAQGYPRSIARLDPPVIDKVNSATNLTRYQDVTENSPARLLTYVSGGVAQQQAISTATYPNPGLDGLGQSIYVNNFGDVQRDSSSLVGGHTLIDEWLHRTSGGETATNTKSGWNGPFYNPPGVDITLGLQQTTMNDNKPYSFYGIKLTRSDVTSDGNPILFKNPLYTTFSPTMLVSYKDLNASNDPTVNPATLSSTALAAYENNPDNDVVIYCAGNVRIKPSMISAPSNETVAGAPRLYNINGTSNPPQDDTLPRHITIVTDGTAYIEGSILKGNPDSTLTVLARDYVCLNTTQFYAGAQSDANPQSTTPPSASFSDSSLLDFGAQNNVLVQNFTLTYPNTSLYISGGPGATGATEAQYDFVNPQTDASVTGAAPFDNPLISSVFDSINGIAPNVVGVTPNVNPAVPAGGPTGLMHITFNLSNDADLNGLTGQPLQLWTRMFPGVEGINPSVSVSTNQDYLQQRSAILPMDITIQAVLYAQDKSFFVIPGPWFNTDSSDVANAFAQTTSSGVNFVARPGMSNADVSAANANQARFPFYGQPVDLKITIDGAVSENEPAPISAQSAWMQKWGWIPQCHGNIVGQNGGPVEYSGHNPSGATAGPTSGLTFVYDPEAGFPYDSASGNYLRYDLYGRPLPFSPKLPVCPGLLYSGQGNPQSLLQ